MAAFLKNLYHFVSPKRQSIFLDYKVNMTPRWGFGKQANPHLLEIIEKGRSRYVDILKAAPAYFDQLKTIRKSNENANALAPVYNNGFLPGMDIAMIYTIIRENSPAKYVEVGSGNSTKVAAKAKHDAAIDMEIISIDPMPRAEIDQLANTIVRVPFETTDISIFAQLGENDIVFIDNSHRVLPNSDATVFFMEVLPILKKGVIVHVHDIYLPYDYPQVMCDRAYSEQYGLAAFILANPVKYEVMMPNYFVSEDPELSKLLSPLFDSKELENVERHGGSFWIRIAK
jgi:predicted O-methyltransferase YrrM